MAKFKPYKKKFHITLVNFILLSSIFIVPLLTLIQPVGSNDWWDEDWAFRKQITINHTMVNATLENFPILIDIIDADLKTKAQSDGDDIVFVGANNGTLRHEIEHYDSTSGHLVAWVKIPSLSSAEATILHMYYANPEARNQQNASLVWDSNFIMVQHLEESSTSRNDSASNGNNGTAYNGVLKSLAGKVDGADEFDGVDDYVGVPNSSTLDITGPVTIEAWFRSKRGLASEASAWYGGIEKSFAYELAWQGWTDGWTFQIYEGGTRLYLDSRNVYMPRGEWRYVVGLYDGRYLKVFIDGQLVATKDVGSRIVDSNNNAFQIGLFGLTYPYKYYWNGTIDEVRISNISRSLAWIQTCYNNQKDPTAFYSLGAEEVSSSASAPLVFDNKPPDEATDVYTNPTLSVRVTDPNRQNMTIIFEQKALNTWQEITRFPNVPDGTYSVIPTRMNKLGTTYYWRVSVTDGENWTNKTLSFTTTTKILQQKWVTPGAQAGDSGVLIADINGDGIEEVFHAGKGGVIAFNGTDGRVIWNVSDSGVNILAQAQMADLNNDGILEIIVPLEKPAGILVLHANDGSPYWRRTDLGLETFGSPVIADIDGKGYPTIFFASSDIYKGLAGTGRITSLSYDGTILHQTFSWRPCSGGLSIADADGDGEFELYMADRHMYLNSPEYGDNDYGKGVQSYWAKNLTLRWYHPDIFCSSHIPMLADVNGDGILEVIIGYLEGGLAILNSTDGSLIRKSLGMPDRAPVHYQPSVYDIDGDGNLEMLMADPHDYTSDDLVVWDLVKWKEDAKLYIGKCYYGAQVADVTGDGIMEIIACNYRSIFILDKTYRLIDGIVGLTSGEVSYGGEVRNIDGVVGLTGTLNYAVVQDIDGDGYNELVVTTQSGYIYAFDTPARRPSQRPRTEVQFYSEYRLGAAEYVPPPGCQQPVIASINPPNNAEDIPLSLSQINFTLTDYQRQPMNYTITTNPQIGNDTQTNLPNRKYTLNITSLTPSTTYTWTINLTDGTNWTNKTFTFTTEPIIPWWNTNWPHRKKITIDNTKISGDLQNFPVLISINNDADLANKAQPHGGDIVFTDTTNSRLNHEIEQYENTTGRLIAWVNVPQLSSTTNTILYMYYGNLTIEDQQRPALVWDSNYVTVQHLQESSTSRNDSTVYGNNGTAYNGVSKSAEAKIDGADEFDGVNDYVGIPDRPTLNITGPVTIEGWFRSKRGLASEASAWYGGIEKSFAYELAWQGWTDGWTFQIWEGGTRLYLDSRNVYMPRGEWRYVVGLYDGRYLKVFIDGQLVATKDVGSRIINSNINPFQIGRCMWKYWNDTIDEVRISNVSRSLAWIQTSYNNQLNPATFYTIKVEENIPQAPVVYAPSPPNKAKHIPTNTTELSFNITDHQGQLMNYAVTTNPNIGSNTNINVASGRFTVSVTGLQYSTTYKWTINVTDGTNTTTITYTFTTFPTEPPTQQTPILIKDGAGNIICYNQTTTDPDGDKVTNIYNWYRNNTSITNLLLPFDTNSSTIAKDYSGYNNHGTIVRGVTWVNNGIVGGAYKFNGGLIQIPGSNTLDGGGQWSEITVEHWIYLTAPQSGTRTIARIPSYEIGISGNQIFASIWVVTDSPWKSGHNKITSNITLQPGTWNHVVLTYKSGVGLTLYVNGSVRAEKTGITGNIQPSGPLNPLYIGWFDYFKGIIDEVRIYPKSLSPQQIYQRYLKTKDGITNSSTIVSQETEIGDTWKCEVTPNDGYQDGIAKFSNSIAGGFGDNFDDNSTNLTIWKKLEKNSGFVSETNGRVECLVETPTSSGTAGYITIKSYDLSDCDIQIDVSNQYLCEAALVITLDGIDDSFWYSDNFYTIEKHRYSETVKIMKRIDGGEPIILYEASWSGPTGSLRIRIHGGIIYFYEEDNLVYFEEFELSSYNCYIHFEANTWGEGYFGTDYFDNFKLLLGPT